MEHWPERPRILYSYAYVTGDQWPVPYDADVIIDSGAYTAHTTGKAVELRAYGEFLLRHANKITFAFNLDVIGDHRGSARNHDRLRALVGDRVKIVPTWHTGSPWQEFERICREEDYASLGGAVGIPTRQLMQYSVKAHRVAREHGTRLHGLGITSNELLLRLPWASVDSSSWVYPYRFPMVILADRDGTVVYGKTGEYPDPKHLPILRAHGISASLVRKSFRELKAADRDAAVSRSRTLMVSAGRSYTHIEGVRRRKHPAFRVYLAASSALQVNAARDAWEKGSPW